MTRTTSRTIVLFCADIPDSSDRVYPYTVAETLRNIIKKSFYKLRWRFFGQFVSDPYAYRVHEYSNRGDEAIRICIERHINAATEHSYDYLYVPWGALKDYLDIINSRDVAAFIIGGGGFYSVDQGGNMRSRWIEEHELINTLNCKKISFATGLIYNQTDEKAFNREFSAAACSILTDHFSSLSYCAMRDSESIDLLSPFSKAKIHLSYDPVFFIAGDRSENPKSEILRVGINFAFHSGNARLMLAPKFKQHVDFLKKIRAIYKCEFTYFVHSELEYGITDLLHASGFKFRIVSGDPDHLARSYHDVDVHVCQMMHSAIMALGACVPTLIVGYDHKHFALARSVEQEKYYIPSYEFDCDRAAGLFEEIVAERSVISMNLKDRMAAIKQSYDASIRDLLVSIE